MQCTNTCKKTHAHSHAHAHAHAHAHKMSAENVTMFRIAWKENATGVTGNGQYCFTQENAVNFLAAAMNILHPEMLHWVEQAEQASAEQASAEQASAEQARAEKLIAGVINDRRYKRTSEQAAKAEQLIAVLIKDARYKLTPFQAARVEQAMAEFSARVYLAMIDKIRAE